jgi:RND family efflux transporter MFP subunit
MTDAPKPPRRRVAGAVLAAAVLAGGAMAVLLAGNGKEPSESEPAGRPLPVETVRVESSPGYTIERRFAGRVEAGRTSEAGFELGGRVAEVAVDEGDVVAAGTVLARLDTARLDARREELEARLRQARTERDLARTTVERVRAAREFDGASRQELDEARERLEAAEAAVDLATSRIASLEVDLRKSVLRAPFEATVTRRHLDEGRVAARGEPVVTLQERGPRTARIGVAGPAIDALAVEQRRTVTVEGRPVSGRVGAVLPVRTPGTRTVDVLVELPAGAARPGDLAVLAVERRVRSEGAWLPLGALSEGERGLWTALVARPVPGEDRLHVLRPRQLALLHEEGGRAFVSGALEPGDRVVATGRHRVVPGQRVTLAGDPAAAEPVAERDPS